MSTGIDTSIRDLITQVREGQATILTIGGEAENRKVTVERRQLQPEPKPEPVRAPTGAREHTFHAVDGFIDYLVRYGVDKGTVVLADHGGGVREPAVRAIIDDRAERGVEVISLTPQVHPRWKPWADLLDRKLSLAALVEFLRMNRRAVVACEGTPTNGRELLFALAQIRAATSVELHQGSGNGSSNGLVVTTKISGGKGEPVDLPERFTVRSPIYIDLAPQDVELDLVLSASKDGAEVFAQFASADIREAQIEAFEVMRSEIHRRLVASPEEGSPSVIVAAGRPEWEAWELL